MLLRILRVDAVEKRKPFLTGLPDREAMLWNPDWFTKLRSHKWQHHEKSDRPW